MSTAGHNSYNVAAGELQQFVSQIEGLESEKKDIADQIKEIYSEAKARGYDASVLRLVIQRRKKNRDDLAETEAILELYETALAAALDV